MAEPVHRAGRAPRTKAFFAPKPTRWTLFVRTFIPWQLIRFAWINFKMVDMIRVSHRSHR